MKSPSDAPNCEGSESTMVGRPARMLSTVVELTPTAAPMKMAKKHSAEATTSRKTSRIIRTARMTTQMPPKKEVQHEQQLRAAQHSLASEQTCSSAMNCAASMPIAMKAGIIEVVCSLSKLAIRSGKYSTIAPQPAVDSTAPMTMNEGVPRKMSLQRRPHDEYSNLGMRAGERAR